MDAKILGQLSINRRAALGGALSCFVLGDGLAAAATAAPPLFGVYTGYAGHYADGTLDYLHTEAMLGRPLQALTAFGDCRAPSGWGDGTGNVNNTMESSARYDLSQLANTGKQLIWAQPLAMGNSAYAVFGYGGDTAHPRSGLNDVASGAFDKTFAYIGSQLVAYGQSRAIVRIGWEFNLPGFPWGNPYADQQVHATAYVAAFRHVVKVMRAVSGNRFQFLWCPYKGKPSSPTTNAALAYPGDDVVDLIGMDAYDDDLDYNNPQGYGTNLSVTRQQRWQQSCLGTIPDQRLAWLAAFAKTPSMRPMVNGSPASGAKPIVIAEWGAGGPTTIQDSANDTYARAVAFLGGDDGYYVAQMLAWMKANAVYCHGLYDIFDPSINYTGAISWDPGVTGVSTAGYPSNTVNTLSTGPKPFTVAANLPFKVGMPLIVQDVANPSQRFLETIVTSYANTLLEVNSFAFKGTGYLNNVTIKTHPSALAPNSLAAIRNGA